jgi:hypothetical protein
MILQRTRPPLLETPFKVFDKGVFTPNDRFYVRWHLPNTPRSIDPANFRLKVRGQVPQPDAQLIWRAISGRAGRCIRRPSVATDTWRPGLLRSEASTIPRLNAINHEANMKETDMSKHKTLYALPVLLFLAGVLPGCATSGKCESGGCSGDAKITANVQALFQQHPDLGPPNLISVHTLDGVVYLSGEVSSSEFSASAESVAHEVPGVTRIVNTIATSR